MLTFWSVGTPTLRKRRLVLLKYCSCSSNRMWIKSILGFSLVLSSWELANCFFKYDLFVQQWLQMWMYCFLYQLFDFRLHKLDNFLCYGRYSNEIWIVKCSTNHIRKLNNGITRDFVNNDIFESFWQRRERSRLFLEFFFRRWLAIRILQIDSFNTRNILRPLRSCKIKFWGTCHGCCCL